MTSIAIKITWLLKQPKIEKKPRKTSSIVCHFSMNDVREEGLDNKKGQSVRVAEGGHKKPFCV